MAEGRGGSPPPGHDRPERGAGERAADWITIWQSELAAMATDPELHESWVRQMDFWAESAQRAVRLLAGGADAAGPHAGTAAAPGAPAAMAAPDARDAAIDRLAQRVAELERQFGRPGPGGPDVPGGPSRP